jgi:hypothetical protein
MTGHRTPVHETELVGVGEFLDYLATDFPGGTRDDHTHLSLMRLTSFLIQPSPQERLQRFENRRRTLSRVSPRSLIPQKNRTFSRNASRCASVMRCAWSS